jgi:hypothetical protein
MEYKKYNKRIQYILSIPIIWGMLFPLFVFDFCLEIYHRACFYLYDIKFVSRKRFIKIDRHKLSYLNFIDKINCAYCGYGVGLLRYALEIARQTENFWCSIQHDLNGDEFKCPIHHKAFMQYGDKKTYQKLKKYEFKK